MFLLLYSMVVTAESVNVLLYSMVVTAESVNVPFTIQHGCNC